MRLSCATIILLFSFVSFAIGQLPDPPSSSASATETATINSGTSDTNLNSGTPDANLPIADKAKMADLMRLQPGQVNGYVRPNKKARFNHYVKSMFGPMALGTRVVKAGYSTWRNSPEEWGPTWEGFGRRFASGTGKSGIKNTTAYALEEAFILDSRFYRSTKKDFGSRVRNALISPVTARKPDGKRVFGFPRIAGSYASSIIASETWYPARYDWKDGVKSATISLGFSAAVNLVKEFIWKK